MAEPSIASFPRFSDQPLPDRDKLRKIVVAQSAAVALAAILRSAATPSFARKRMGIIVSGGNVDLQRLPWLVS